MRCVLVSCCGLPAAGKTTFCRCVAANPVTMPAVSWTPPAVSAAPGARTETLSPKREREARIRVSHVCFDEYIERAHRRRRPSGTEHSSPSGTRTNPDPVLATGNESAEDNLATEMAPRVAPTDLSGDGARVWHEGRQAALAEVEALASAQETTGALSAVEAPRPSADRRQSSLCSEAASAMHVVLVDDNMHFRTMRHEVFSLARKCACASQACCCELWTRAVDSNLYAAPSYLAGKHGARIESMLSL